MSRHMDILQFALEQKRGVVEWNIDGESREVGNNENRRNKYELIRCIDGKLL